MTEFKEKLAEQIDKTDVQIFKDDEQLKFEKENKLIKDYRYKEISKDELLEEVKKMPENITIRFCAWEDIFLNEGCSHYYIRAFGKNSEEK